VKTSRSEQKLSNTAQDVDKLAGRLKATESKYKETLAKLDASTQLCNTVENDLKEVTTHYNHLKTEMARMRGQPVVYNDYKKTIETMKKSKSESKIRPMTSKPTFRRDNLTKNDFNRMYTIYGEEKQKLEGEFDQ